MPAHDIIDNRNERLVDHINQILSSTEAARFAVGYFFLSGFTSVAEKLSGIKELRLLIGNTTNRETLEQIAEGYRRLELVAEAAEAERYPKRTDIKRIASETGENIRTGIELMDQTDEGEELVKNLVRMIEEKRLKVRIYTKGRLHAKTYLFESAIRLAVSLGGDSDTIACMTGSMAEAYYGGVPEDIQEQVFRKLDDRQKDIVKEFLELYK